MSTDSGRTAFLFDLDGTLVDSVYQHVLAWLFGPVPMYLLWFAEQPWPLSLTIKQLVLDLFTMLVLGTLTSMLYKPAPSDSHQL